MTNWKEMHPEFDENSGLTKRQENWRGETETKKLTYQQTWLEKGVDYQEAKQWIDVGFMPWQLSEVLRWKSKDFTPEQTKEWIDVGLKSCEADFTSHLKQNNCQPSQLSLERLFELRKEFYPSYPQSKSYLDQNYPCTCRTETIYGSSAVRHRENCVRKNTKELNLRNLNLERDLDLKKFWWENLKKVYISGNPNLGEIEKYDSFDYHTKLIYQNPEEAFFSLLKKKQFRKEQIGTIHLDFIKAYGYDEPSELTIKDYPILKKIQGQDNSSLVRVTISNCPQLEEVNISKFENKQELILYNLPKLRELDCSASKLVSLDLTNFPNLEKINCSDSHLTKINLPTSREKLRDLNLKNNKLIELDISNYPNLKNLWLDNNLLVKLNLSGDKKLEHLNLSNNNFHRDLFFLKGLVGLKYLNLSNNHFEGNLEPLKEIKKLRKFDIRNNNIDSSLDNSLKDLPVNLEELYGVEGLKIYGSDENQIKIFRECKRDQLLDYLANTLEAENQRLTKELTENNKKLEEIAKRLLEELSNEKDRTEETIQKKKEEFNKLKNAIITDNESIKEWLKFKLLDLLEKQEKATKNESDSELKERLEYDKGELIEKVDKEKINQLCQLKTEITKLEMQSESIAKERQITHNNYIYNVQSGDTYNVQSKGSAFVGNTMGDADLSTHNTVYQIQYNIQQQLKTEIDELKRDYRELEPVNESASKDSQKIKKTILLLATKKILVNTRQNTINSLVGAGEGSKKYDRIATRLEQIGGLIGGVEDFAGLVPGGGIAVKVLSKGLPIAANILKRHSFRNQTKEFKDYLIEDEKSLTLLQETYQSLEKSLQSEKQSKINSVLAGLFSVSQNKLSQYSVFKIGDLKEEEKLTEDKINQIIDSLTEHLENLAKELSEEVGKFVDEMDNLAEDDKLLSEVGELLNELNEQVSQSQTQAQIIQTN